MRKPTPLSRLTRMAAATAAASCTCAATAADVTWVGPNLSFWDLVANWSPGLPGATDDVLLGTFDTEFRSGNVTVLSMAGTGTLRVSGGTLQLAQASSIGGLLVSAGTLGGAGDLAVAGGATWSGGSLGGAGSTGFAGPLAITGPSTKGLSGGRTLNAANTTWSGNTGANNTIAFANASVFNNTGSFTDSNAFNSTMSGAGRFNNAGTFDKQSNTVTTFGVVFDNSGTLNVNAGTVLLNGGGTSTGTFNIAAGATLEYRNGNHTLNNVTLSGLGTFQVSTENVGADAVVTLNGGTLLTPLLLSGSTLTGSDQVFQRTATWTGGTLSGAASTTFEQNLTISGPNLKVLVGGRTANLQATTTWSGNTGNNNNAIRFWNGATINNFGTFNDANDFASFIEHNVGGPHAFNNIGTYSKLKNTITTVDLGVAFNNTGVLNIDAGVFRPNGGGTSTGVFNIANGATLEFINGASTLNTATIAGAGLLKISTDSVGADAVATINGGTLSTALLLSGSTLAGTNHTFTGPVTWTGGAISGASSTTFSNDVAISGAGLKTLVSGRTLNLEKTTTWSGNTGNNNNAIRFWNGATINNFGTFNDANAFDSFIEHNVGGPHNFNNLGTYNKLNNTLTTVDLGVVFNNSGTLNIDAGTMRFTSSLQGTTGTVKVAAGATYQHDAASSLGTLVDAGNLVLSNRSLTVHEDYDNANFGFGNAFAARANVSGTGQILAAGTAAAMQVITGAGLPSGSGISGGDTATPTLTIGNVRVGNNPLAYQVANQNIGGPALRGAIQTTVGGANINDARLSGSGVSEGNFGPIASGSSTGFAVNFNAPVAGLLTQPLVGQVVRIANNFDNVAEQNLSIVLGSGAAAFNPAQGSTTPTPVVIAAQRVGGSNSQALTVANSATAGPFSEALNAAFSGSTGAATHNGGSVTDLAAGANNPSALAVGVDTATSGFKSGTVTLAYQSDGTGANGHSGLAAIAAGSQTINVSGNVYAPAVAQVNTGTVNFGIVHKGDVVPAQAVSVSNTAAIAAPNDVLVGSLGGASGPFSASGTLAGVAAQGTDATSLVVSLDTSSAGVFSGSATASFASRNAEMSDLALGGAAIALSAQVNNFAELGLDKTGGAGSLGRIGSTYTLDFGSVLQGSGALDAGLAVLNLALGPADVLSGSFAIGAGSAFMLSGFDPFADIAAGTSAGDLSIRLSDADIGSFQQTITISAFGSNASGFQQALPDTTLVLRASVVAVPEPATYGMLGLGLLVISWASRRAPRLR